MSAALIELILNFLSWCTERGAREESSRHNNTISEIEKSRKRGEEAAIIQEYREVLQSLAFIPGSVSSVYDVTDLEERLKSLQRAGDLSSESVQNAQLSEFLKTQSTALSIILIRAIYNGTRGPFEYPYNETRVALEHLSDFTRQRLSEEERSAVTGRWKRWGTEATNDLKKNGL